MLLIIFRKHVLYTTGSSNLYCYTFSQKTYNFVTRLDFNVKSVYHFTIDGEEKVALCGEQDVYIYDFKTESIIAILNG